MKGWGPRGDRWEKCCVGVGKGTKPDKGSNDVSV